MELELEWDTIGGYETIAETTICQEETLESIVPDACPDILRIVDVCGQATLGTKQAQDGVVSVSGMIQTVILYQPEGGGGLRRMEAELPFTCRAEIAGLTDRGKVLASPRLRSAEARALNPRKVLLRVDLEVDITVCQPCERTFCRAVTANETDGICQRQYAGEHYYLSDVQEKPFIFEDQIFLKTGQGEPPRLLGCRVHPVCNESKLIGSKLILKGTADLSLLLQDQGGGLTSSQQSLPFSQVMEITGAGEDNDCDVVVEVTNVKLEPDEDRGQSLNIKLDLLAQAQVHSHRPMVLLEDLYSTSHMTESTSERQVLCSIGERTAIPQAVRELIEIDTGVRSVVDCRLTLGHIQQSQEDTELVLETTAELSVLYLDENEQFQCIQKAIPISCKLTCDGNTRCRCCCSRAGEVYATPTAGGVEIRFNVEFSCLTSVEHEIMMVCAAQLGNCREREDGTSPSAVLRLPAPDEKLWDIAKEYGTTEEQILKANMLDNAVVPDGMMLLIPCTH